MNALGTLLQTCFTAMSDMPSGGDDFFAAQLATALVSTGPTFTPIGGVIVTVVVLPAPFSALFASQPDDDALADGLADAIDTAFSAAICVRADGNPGAFHGAKASMSSALKSCFSDMADMDSGGDDEFADKFGQCVQDYVTQGSVA
jgi:hypothetical protein